MFNRCGGANAIFFRRSRAEVTLAFVEDIALLEDALLVYMHDLLGGVDSLCAGEAVLLAGIDDILEIGFRASSPTCDLGLLDADSGGGGFFCIVNVFLSVGTCFALCIISSNGIS